MIIYHDSTQLLSRVLSTFASRNTRNTSNILDANRFYVTSRYFVCPFFPLYQKDTSKQFITIHHKHITYQKLEIPSNHSYPCPCGRLSSRMAGVSNGQMRGIGSFLSPVLSHLQP